MSDHSFYSLTTEFEERGLGFDPSELTQDILVSLNIPLCQWDIYVPVRKVCDALRRAVDAETSEAMVKIVSSLVGYNGKVIF